MVSKFFIKGKTGKGVFFKAVYLIYITEALYKKDLSFQYFLKDITTFIQNGDIKLIKCGSKDIYDVTKGFYFK